MCYDKVTLWIGRSFTPQCIDKMASRLNIGKRREDLRTGIVTMEGAIRGMKLYFRPNGLSIVGSLPKFLYDDNIHPLTRGTTGQAIEGISEAIGIDISDAKVTGLEFGMVYPVSFPVPDYLSRLGELHNMHRYRFAESTLYYKSKGRNQAKMLCFYDKIEDARAKGVTLPIGFEDANLLKYELRLRGRIAQRLGVNDVTASSLSDTFIYGKLVNMYQSEYMAIHKQRKADNNMKSIKTVSDACEVLLGRLINDGEQGKIERYIEELKHEGIFANSTYYTRVKKKLLVAVDKASGGCVDNVIKELDNDINNLGAYI